MARKTIEQRLAELDAQRATLKARLGKQERANDTRRKVLLGALVLHRLESGKDEEFSRRLREWLKGVVSGRGRNPTLRLWPAIFSGEIDVLPSERRDMSQQIGR